jgi:hypothetical protein
VPRFELDPDVFEEVGLANRAEVLLGEEGDQVVFENPETRLLVSTLERIDSRRARP